MTYPILGNMEAGLPERFAEADRTDSSRRLILTWLLGTLVLLPVKIFHLPFNMEIVDLCVVLGLPVVFLLLAQRRQLFISLPYAAALLLILVASFVSIISNPTPVKSLIVILKEIYLFVWFITVTAVFCGADDKDFRRLMAVWSGTAILHGLLIIAQFMSPEIWRMTANFGGQTEAYAIYRPAGLFISEKAGDANKAAGFQVLGFVPLLLARPSKGVATVLAMLLFASILATGSMGTSSAFLVGLVFAVVVMIIFGQNVLPVTKYLMQLLVTVALLTGAGLFLLSQDIIDQTHVESIVFGRAERSSGGRFEMWERAIELFQGRDNVFFGIGPENFREVDWNAKQLHNDTIAFTIERGLVGTIGLLLFAGAALHRAICVLNLGWRKSREEARPELIVLPAAMVVVLVLSLTHQVFHARELWLVLAVQEGIFFKMTAGKTAAAAESPQPLPAANLSYVTPMNGSKPFSRRLRE